MGRHTLEGNPPIEVTLRHSARAKRLSLRISRLDGRVTLTLPQRAAHQEGVAFLKAREAWLRGHLNDLSPVTEVQVGGTVLVEGQEVRVVLGTGRHVSLEPDRVVVPSAKMAGPHIMALLKTRARERLAEVSDQYAARLGKSYSRLSLRDTRSRWGSCSSKGALMYSWRLIMAPPAVLRYVAAHEVAHLVEMNHSSAFWDLVEELYPNHAPHRRWLRENGDQLHRFKFTD